MEFPKDFLWGASTSAYQIEGNNKNSDWWEWEMLGKIKYASASACGSYELFTEDFDIAKSLSHNAHRLSVEWGRIEPEEGKFSKEEIGHYRKVILALRERGLEPIVTLHHFTSPIWFTRNYGWSNASCRKYFLRYCAKIVSALAEDVHFWITINEPTIYAYYSYIFGYWPPQEKSVLKAISVINNFAQVHINAYSLIHSIYQEKNLTPPEISIAHHLQAFVPCNLNFRNRLAYYLRNKLHNLYFIERLARKHALDFIGITAGTL
ncbi:MAG: family 1 glycosylhydrolase [Candidatus Omnitrophica bacterium]|nr:family 1 glycosylhydrolase [Candidatus Omnitrophota bacterium]